MAGDSVIIDEELQIKTIEPGVFLIEHRFPGPCNSLLVQCPNNTFVWVDTPLTDQATQKVHEWLLQTYTDPNIIQINTGFHNDNLAGNGYLINQGIPCYGSDLTPTLIKECWDQTVQKVLPYYERAGQRYRNVLINHKLVSPNKLYPLSKGLVLEIGTESMEVYFPGPSHTRDNVVVYFKQRRLLFGGCMIKALNARTPGFTGDADMKAWPTSAKKVLERYPEARIVIPGHGHWGDLDLVRHTIKVCEQYNKENP
jgi:glyoxylase-like metal-dependent hydrolase (beta-lactamase superfamily II)